MAGKLEAHLVLPLEDGGAAYDLGNITTLCRSCHVAKHRRELTAAEAEWRELVKGLV